jgi:hypothetical protein
MGGDKVLTVLFLRTQNTTDHRRHLCHHMPDSGLRVPTAARRGLDYLLCFVNEMTLLSHSSLRQIVVQLGSTRLRVNPAGG